MKAGNARRTSVPLGLAVVGLLVAASVVALTRSSSETRREGADPFVEPSSDLQVAIEPTEDDARLNQVARARVRVVVAREFPGLQMTLEGLGVARPDGDVSSRLPPPPPHGDVTADVAFSISGSGPGEVRVAVAALDGEGEATVTRSDTLYVEGVPGGDGVQSVRGRLDARLRALERQRSALPAAEYRSQVERALGAGAEQTVAVVPPRPQASDPVVSGTIRYTDSAGGSHPVRTGPVELRTCGDGREPSVLASAETDSLGAYAIAFDQSRSQPGGGVALRALARGPGFDIRGRPPAGTHYIESGCVPLPAGNGLALDLTANNVDDNNTAFSVRDALVTGSDYVLRLRGSRLPDVTVDFPTATPTSNWNFRNDHLLHVLEKDRFDWDVILHEYGHFVSDEVDIAGRAEGRHGLDENLANRLGKDTGLTLAWREGWPTYFSVSAQRAMGAASWNIPNVGDTDYSDTEDANPPLRYGLASQEGVASKGEDNELSVQRVLWQLSSGTARLPGLGDAGVWNLLVREHPHNLWQLYRALVTGRSPGEIAAVGCVLGEHKVAPQITSPADGSRAELDSPPAVAWAANGGRPARPRDKFPPNLNDAFVVEVYDADFRTSLFRSPEQQATELTLGARDWQVITGSGQPFVNVVVHGRQTNSPQTGPYTGCSIRLALPVLPLLPRTD
ncbi:MAG TPA: hypothetical protein VHH09_00870 [Acidimicrobiales bacterium]|nr:hypothetical protein [Acidimicrobiales bacterium]